MKNDLPVLVVEDSFLIAAALEETLVEAGLKVKVARSVGEAEAMMSQMPFAAALLDYVLPDGESLPLAQALHAAGCKVAVVSGIDRGSVPDDDAIAMHFPKPMDDREVTAWVRQVTGAGAGPQHAAVR